MDAPPDIQRIQTRSRTRQTELEQIEAKQALAARAEWPPNKDPTIDIQRMTRELRLCDVPRDAHKELQKVLTDLDENQNQNFSQPPAAGLMTQHQDVFFIPPPRVVGGARGISAPVSTATLGLIHRQDPSLAAQLQNDARTTLVRRAQRRAQRTSEGFNRSGRKPEPELLPASSGWSDDPTPGCVFHPSPSRCWWREGDLGPSEYGNAGADS